MVEGYSSAFKAQSIAFGLSIFALIYLPIITDVRDEMGEKLEELADTNCDGKLSKKERVDMYDMCGAFDKKFNYELDLKDLRKGVENYENRTGPIYSNIK